MRIVVDLNRCQGYAQCVPLAPERPGGERFCPSATLAARKPVVHRQSKRLRRGAIALPNQQKAARIAHDGLCVSAG